MKKDSKVPYVFSSGHYLEVLKGQAGLGDNTLATPIPALRWIRPKDHELETTYTLNETNRI